jgi:hypothetical protein
MPREWPRSAKKGSTRPLDCLTVSNHGWEPRLSSQRCQCLSIAWHVSGIADPFNGRIDAFRISHVQRSDGWIETTWNNMSDPGAFAVARPRSSKAANRRRWQAPVWSPASWGEGTLVRAAIRPWQFLIEAVQLCCA